MGLSVIRRMLQLQLIALLSNVVAFIWAWISVVGHGKRVLIVFYGIPAMAIGNYMGEEGTNNCQKTVLS